MGFSHLMTIPDGAMIYGIFHLLTGACSQQRRPRNGWLTADGQQTGSPWLVEDMAVKFRRPVSEIQRALVVLSSDKIGWIVCHNGSPSNNHGVTSESPPSHLEGKGKEGKEGEGREAPLKISKPEFIALDRDLQDLKRQYERLRDADLPKQVEKRRKLAAQIQETRKRMGLAT
jgi:hypothetical protein